MAVSLLPFIQNLFITCGQNGGSLRSHAYRLRIDICHVGVIVVLRIVGEEGLSGSWALERTRLEQHQIIARGKDSLLVLKHYPAFPIEGADIVNVTGAGDSFAGALLAALCQGGGLDTPQAMDKVVERAQRASVLALCSPEAVSPLLTEGAIDNRRQ